MKKLMSLVLVLALCLTAVAAFADTPSKGVDFINVFVNEQKCNEFPTLEAMSASNAELIKLVQKGPAAYFGTEVNDVFEFSPLKVLALPEGVEAAEGQVEAVFSAGTKFAANEELVIMLGDGANWNGYAGVANEDGDVVATVDVDDLLNTVFCAIVK